MADRGGCEFIVKVRNAQRAGAAAAIIADNEPGLLIYPGASSPTSDIANRNGCKPFATATWPKGARSS